MKITHVVLNTPNKFMELGVKDEELTNEEFDKFMDVLGTMICGKNVEEGRLRSEIHHCMFRLKNENKIVILPKELMQQSYFEIEISDDLSDKISE